MCGRALAVEIDKEKLRKMFPHLATELKGEEKKVTITSVRSKR